MLHVAGQGHRGAGPLPALRAAAGPGLLPHDRRQDQASSTGPWARSAFPPGMSWAAGRDGSAVLRVRGDRAWCSVPLRPMTTIT